MKPARSLLVRVALLSVGAALLASGAVAATRPDDRAGPLGSEAQAISPASAHPDSKAGIRGVGEAAVSPAAAHPDNRAGVRGGSGQVLSPAAAHPDNRVGVRGVPALAVASGGTDWTTIGIGVGAGIAALLLVVAAVLTIRGGGHRPHRPVLGH